MSSYGSYEFNAPQQSSPMPAPCHGLKDFKPKEPEFGLQGCGFHHPKVRKPLACSLRLQSAPARVAKIPKVRFAEESYSQCKQQQQNNNKQQQPISSAAILLTPPSNVSAHQQLLSQRSVASVAPTHRSLGHQDPLANMLPGRTASRATHQRFGCQVNQRGVCHSVQPFHAATFTPCPSHSNPMSCRGARPISASGNMLSCFKACIASLARRTPDFVFSWTW